jgi:hypothetical protein
MLGVEHRFVEQRRDVVIVKCIDDLATSALADDEAELAQGAQLVRDSRGFHRDGVGEIPYRTGSLAQPSENANAAGGRERLHGHRDGGGGGLVYMRGRRRFALDSVGHMHMIARRLTC